VDPKTRLQQLRAITAAYKSLTSVETPLPAPESPIPALLALQKTQQVIEETRASIGETSHQLSVARKKLSQEEADLRDAHLITVTLEKRIQTIRLEFADKSQKSPDQAAQDLIHEQQKRKAQFDKETRRLVRAFNRFIDEHLAGMLAAEELGGPVVGDLIDVDDEILEAGFNQQGTAKKPRGTTQNQGTKRQRRIDVIWGEEPETEERREREVAGAEMRALTEELLNAAADDNTSGAYVQLGRDSAAARFLVRAKVAQFHPRDARRLRLVDFARELEN